MNDPDHKIFRPDAVQRYLRGRQTPVWPRLVSPPVFLCLWILAGLLLAAGLSAWAFRVPVSISGTATVVRGTNGEMVIVAFFAPANLPRLDAGQKLVLSSPDGRGGFIEAIVSVKPAIISPEAARQRFALGVGAAHLITQPSAIAVARLDASDLSLPAEAYLASTFRADVEVGSRRVISLLPVIGRFLEA
jgi:hypothetical protein